MTKKYQYILAEQDERVGIISLNAPPNNSLSKKMIYEIFSVLDDWESRDDIRTVMFKSALPMFSGGANAPELIAEMDAGETAGEESYSELGGRLVERIETYPKSTLVAATGKLFGGTTVLFSACDIRIGGENLNLKDGDIYYGLVASWGMSSLRLPLWIGRNKVMDYMFLNEEFTGRQAYELGLVSKVVPDEMVDEVGLSIAKKMSKAAPIAVRYYKECVRRSIYHDLAAARAFELEASEIVYSTEDSKKGIANITAGIPYTDFDGK